MREIEIRYRKKKVAAKSAVGKRIKGAKQVADLFADLQNEISVVQTSKFVKIGYRLSRLRFSTNRKIIV